MEGFFRSLPHPSFFHSRHPEGYHFVEGHVGMLLMLEAEGLDGAPKTYLVADGVLQRGKVQLLGAKTGQSAEDSNDVVLSVPVANSTFPLRMFRRKR